MPLNFGPQVQPIHGFPATTVGVTGTPAGAMKNCVRLRGMPYSAQGADILKFLGELLGGDLDLLREKMDSESNQINYIIALESIQKTHLFHNTTFSKTASTWCSTPNNVLPATLSSKWIHQKTRKKPLSTSQKAGVIKNTWASDT